MTESNATEPPYCEGHYRLLSIKCWRCWDRVDCRWVTAANDYMEEKYNKKFRETEERYDR